MRPRTATPLRDDRTSPPLRFVDISLDSKVYRFYKSVRAKRDATEVCRKGPEVVDCLQGRNQLPNVECHEPFVGWTCDTFPAISSRTTVCKVDIF